MNINPMQQQMGQMNPQMGQMGQINPQMIGNNDMDMQQRMMQQMQQQMMQQQMMAAQAAQAQQAAMQKILDETGISVVFRQSGLPDDLPKIEPIWIYGCYPEQKVSSIIEQYRSKSGDYDSSKKFIFNAKNLSPLLTVAEAGISNNANIFVVKMKGIKINK